MHVNSWRCEHAMLCVDILMYQISLIHACMYINYACNFIFMCWSVAVSTRFTKVLMKQSSEAVGSSRNILNATAGHKSLGSYLVNVAKICNKSEFYYNLVHCSVVLPTSALRKHARRYSESRSRSNVNGAYACWKTQNNTIKLTFECWKLWLYSLYDSVWMILILVTRQNGVWRVHGISDRLLGSSSNVWYFFFTLLQEKVWLNSQFFWSQAQNNER